MKPNLIFKLITFLLVLIYTNTGFVWLDNKSTIPFGLLLIGLVFANLIVAIFIFNNELAASNSKVEPNPKRYVYSDKYKPEITHILNDKWEIVEISKIYKNHLMGGYLSVIDIGNGYLILEFSNFGSNNNILSGILVKGEMKLIPEISHETKA